MMKANNNGNSNQNNNDEQHCSECIPQLLNKVRKLKVRGNPKRYNLMASIIFVNKTMSSPHKKMVKYEW